MLNRLEMLRIFVAAAEARSFKEAAVRLRISPQAVTRAVQDLEAAQGELLFHRNTRGIQITTYGEHLAAQARDSVQRVDALFQPPAEAATAQMEGLVRLTAPVALGRMLMLPLLSALSGDHPLLRFDVQFSDTHADVVDDRIDIGVRFGSMRDSRYVARSVAPQPFRTVGTPELIARHGKPKSIEQLHDLPTTSLRDHSTGKAWPWYFAGGQHISPLNPRFLSSDSEAEFDAVMAGMGFGQLPGFMADPHIASGRLVPVLQKHQPEPWDIYVYRPQRGPVPARIRLVFDQLVARLAS
ncbi:LysR family transcriptional regulator [Duganella dendranthematis]|uniref:LysR family transcriptional regulator n=1 Tax=Duganella dendranthematis TaxID=2728021 RepID=A0ABX6MA02_9BURK|nr:LysR family transcriptional regulator [Duganella dendranthematis]QJD91149.1 LysR family transcriptional regulator [Duganella dendranthematis]